MRGTTKFRDLPAKQRRNIEELFKNKTNLDKLSSDLQKAYERRNKLVLRVFDEIEKNASHYFHSPQEAKPGAEPVPMTPELVGRLRDRYLQANRPLEIRGGPGCDSPPVCPPKPDCVCIFSVGTLCCYACLSPTVIQCDGDL
jgi:hypothetical protein